MPAKKGRVASNQKERNARNSKLSATQVKEVVKPKLQFGAGWSIDNLAYLQATPPEKVSDELYKIFGIPIDYNDETHPIVQLFIEYQSSSYQFAQQINDPAKMLVVLAVLNDYICSVPMFSNSVESFEKWTEKATNIISKNESFAPNETSAILTYITQNLRSASLIYYYVLTDESIKKMDSEGMQLFRSNTKDSQESNESDEEQQPNNDLEEQLAAAALAEKNKEEALEKEKQLAESIEAMIQENFANIQLALERRNETILQSIGTTEDKLDAIARGKK